MLCPMLALLSSLVIAAFMQLDDGCPFLPQLKHVYPSNIPYQKL
jgi:hypothetical protein